jgi:dsRNA-specific ribonuclease
VTAELVEAVFGALIEDGGLEAVLRLASTVVAETDEGRPAADPKSSLQMVSLARTGTLPSYRLVERWGPAHHPTFRVSVTLSDQAGDLTAEAEGSSRQAAEQKAAEAVLERLQHVSEKHNIL